MKGLSANEARIQQKIFGYNELEKTTRYSPIIQSLLHSINPLIAILFIAAIITAITGNITNASIIILMIMMSIMLEYYQTHRSLKAIHRLQTQVTLNATVYRDNKWIEIPVRELVPKDLIQLTAGDLVPADALLLTAKDLHVQEAALTGESFPVEKKPNESVYAGSSIVSGIATAQIINTGSRTEYGKIAKDLSTNAPSTEFEKGITRFGLFITKTIIFLLLFVFLISILFKHELLESLLFAIALSVGLTPEFLPMITTVTLSASAMALSKQKVIVKNLAAIQNLGSIDILCCDKTGTLTSGEMVLEQYIDPTGKTSPHVLLFSYLNSFFQTGIKNALDLAILKHGSLDIRHYAKIDEIPFDFERRRTSVVVKSNNQHFLITKGAPENILRLCPMDAVTQTQSQELLKNLGEKGYRILAIAYREISQQTDYFARDEKELTLLGFLVFSDPLLPDVAETIKNLQQEGVSVKMITGDNQYVARHIAKTLGLPYEKVILGDDIEQMTDPALAKIAEETVIFARISPSQKKRILSALRSRGHVVGFIGDGINDAPSLHTADVGISVAGAVDVAKEAASMILLERNLSVVLNGIREGRKSFGNVMKYLMMGTSSNFGNMFSMAGAVLFLPFLPMLPSQILLNNLLYDIAQVTIPTDKVDPHFTNKPRRWDISIIRRFMLYIGPISSVFDFLTFYIMIKVFSASEALFQTGWFVESLATQTLVIFIIRTCGNPLKDRPSSPLALTVLIMVAVALLLPFSPFASLFGFVPLPFSYFIFLAGATSLYLLLVQLMKQKLIWRWLT